MNTEQRPPEIAAPGPPAAPRSRGNWVWLAAGGVVVALVALGFYLAKPKTPIDPDEVRVGVVMTLSGPAAPYGQECLNGIQLAIDAGNGSRARKVKLVVLDDKGESIETVNSMTQLIEVQKVVGVFGATASTNTMAGAKVCQESRVPLLVPISTNAAITKQGDYVVRTCFNDPFQGRALAKFAREQLKVGRAAVITDKAMDYSVGLSQSFRENFAALGGTVAGEVFHESNQADYAAVIGQVSGMNPDVIFISGQYSDVAAILKQSGKRWDGIKKLGGDSWDSPKLIDLAGPAVYGGFVCSHFAADDTSPKVKDFVSAYRAKYNAAPGAMGCLGYDAGLVLLDALDRTPGAVTRDRLRDALVATKGLAGVSGVITVTRDREVVKDAVILEVTPTGMKFKSRVQFE